MQWRQQLRRRWRLPLCVAPSPLFPPFGSIPRGGAIELVSGANFLGEILEWTGFAIAAYTPLKLTGALATFQSIPLLGILVSPPVAFALFTASNIGPRALEHHRWYVETFKKAYPKDRKALIPFLL